MNKTIIIDNPDFEIIREGFKPGDHVLAQIEVNGRASFKSLNSDNNCLMYPGDYSILEIKKEDK